MTVKTILKTIGALGGTVILYAGAICPKESQILINGANEGLKSVVSGQLPTIAFQGNPLAGLTFGGWGAIPLGLSVALAWMAYNKSVGRLTAKVGRIKVTKDDQNAAGEALKAGTISPKQRKYLERCYRADIKKRMNGVHPMMGDYFGSSMGYSYSSFENLRKDYRYDATNGWQAAPGKASTPQDIAFLTAISPDGQVKWNKSFYIKRAIEMRQTALSGGANFLAPEKKWQRTAGRTSCYLKNATKAIFTGTLTGCSVAMAAAILGSGAPLTMAGIVAFPFMCKAVKGTWTTANLLVNRGITAPRIR